MFNLDEIDDYRDLLKQYYLRRKADMPLYSYRMMGNKLGLETSQVFRVIQKQYHLPARCVPLAKSLLELTGRAGEIFDILAASSRTRSVTKRKELYEKAYSLRDVERRELQGRELQFLSQWWIPAVRSCLEISGGKMDPDEIASRIIPHISKQQVLEAIEIITDLGFVKKLSANRLAIAPIHFTVGGSEKSAAIRHYQKQAIHLSLDAVETFSTRERDISTLTLTVDTDCFQDLQEMAREFRRQVQKRVEEATQPNQVLQMTIALFPLVPEKRMGK